MLKVNKVVKVLILADTTLLTGLGFVAPIFAIFISENIKGGNVQVVGFAAAIYWIVLSLVLIPSGKYLDKNHGEKDDFWFIVIGSFLAGLAVLGYLFSSLPWHIYVLQAIYALGIGMNAPGYNAIFTRHIDRGKEAFSWSARAAFVGVGAGMAGALGGTIAFYFGFKSLFIGVFMIILLSALLPFLIAKELSPKDKEIHKISETKAAESPKL